MRENLLVGEATEVIERLRKIEALGYDEFSLWIDSGMSFERKRDSLKRFIADVMPAFA
jgi:flavin-dependent trigonelline monooxygenase, oxygenase component